MQLNLITKNSMPTRIFTDLEKKAIGIIVLKLIAADSKIHPEELPTYYSVCKKYDIEQKPALDKTMTNEEAYEIITSMPEEKRKIVKDILKQVAEADGHISDSEAMIFEDLWLGK